MGKRKVFLHIGSAGGSGDVIETAVHHHRHALAELGVRTPVPTPDDGFRAAIEITRQHKAWGYKRKEVEGAWAKICRRLLKTPGKDVHVVSQPLLGVATAEQIDLLLDQLPGTQRHVVITGPALADDTSWPILVERWTAGLGKPERVHTIAGDLSEEEVWREFGRIVGFGTTSLPVTGLVRQRPTDLTAALREVERLARRNDSLVHEISDLRERSEKRKRKLLRRNSAA
ncbi:hypothetical protein GCM10027020_34310 [Nocardioides salsibiostraticola]